ncbi:3'-5' exonuclease [Azospira restricta]|uniref:DNA-directed DNA polymerase n=1 Tax=Azospira restricta TaxID=404405 RepID=A0A974PVQ2_9RHOO|nr:exonuclease domain-containing protein [Azospira restricta]QRJ62369.1 PAS domain-containing protein [Azospira restricta]
MRLGPPHKLALATALAALAAAGLIYATVAVLRSAAAAGNEDASGALVIVWLLASGALFAALRPLADLLLRAPRQLAEETRIVVADSGARVKPAGSGELRALADAINELAARRQALEQDVAAEIARAQASVEADRNRLAVLMAELQQSVVVCNLDGRILLYNQRAREVLSAGAGSELVGLGRSLYAVFERSLIAHALEQVARRLAAGEPAAAEFVTATRAGRLLRVHLAPVAGQEEGSAAGMTGFVLLLDDITASFETEGRRDALIQSLTEGSRGPLGNIRAAAEMLSSYPDMNADERSRFLSVIRSEVEGLSGRVEHSAREYARELTARWPLEEMRGADLIAVAVPRVAGRSGLPVKTEEVDESVWMKVDSFSFLQVLCYLTARLRDEYGVNEVRLALSSDGDHACLDLAWLGTAMSTETVMNWELDPMRSAGEETPLSVREVMDRCNGEMWFQRKRASHRAAFRFLLPLAQARQQAGAVPGGARGSRPEFYDFDLFRWSEKSHALDDRPLGELTYTVFDTETTGLEPSKGDEIIQIGATRIVNRRLLTHEVFDQLVDPRRPLPSASVQIHGITPEMLVGQPDIGSVLPAFREFCADTVLVAHNAAFDMRFLQLKENSTGIRFDLPVLDTLLLSALLHPNQESHRLEAIAERFGVPVIGRHTALGDAYVTGEVFLKMLPLLAEMGIRTLGEAREAAEKTYYARISY